METKTRTSEAIRKATEAVKRFGWAWRRFRCSLCGLPCVDRDVFRKYDELNSERLLSSMKCD